MSKSAISRARDIVGGTTVLADILGLKPPTVSEWITGKRPVPDKYCPVIERATLDKGKVVTCEELCPEVDWGYLRRKPPLRKPTPGERASGDPSKKSFAISPEGAT